MGGDTGDIKNGDKKMTLVRALWGMLALLILSGLIILAMWGIPAPSIRVEKIIPHDKLSQ